MCMRRCFLDGVARRRFSGRLRRVTRRRELLLREELPEYVAGRRTPVPQPVEGVTHAPPLRKEQGWLDFALAAPVLERRVRAFTPWPGAFVFLGPLRLKVLQAALAGGDGGAAGSVVRADALGLDVACGEGVLRLLRVQPEGKKPMDIGPFLTGHPVPVGGRPFARPDVPGSEP
jgi:methionyl-tRNA formyltransferase